MDDTPGRAGPDAAGAPSPRGAWRRVLDLPAHLAAASLFVLMAMTLADVVLRSAFNAPIEWATELTRLFMAIAVFASLPAVSWRGAHIVVDLTDPLFSRRAARVRDAAVDLACGLLLLWPAARVLALAERARDYGDVTEYMGMPQFLTGWFIAAFAFAAAGALVCRGILRAIRPDLAHGSGAAA